MLYIAVNAAKNLNSNNICFATKAGCGLNWENRIYWFKLTVTFLKMCGQLNWHTFSFRSLKLKALLLIQGRLAPSLHTQSKTVSDVINQSAQT